MPRPDVIEHFKKEFIIEMQAKGKIPRVVTEASERHDHAYHLTNERIFPGPGGMETVLTNMLKETTKRIENAQKSKEGRPVLKDEERLARRKELRERLAQIETELSTERQARTEAEHMIASIRAGGLPGV
ncbi:hypothetical protein CEUSTIGMA_g6667.t1 [Chlamydomonas eustigma]|uniref:Uncharacterized protein n=1 Tax=Chlamydomonas eustigma TaxID=1157962 RepID=A0A250X836_9CHLO|nr:hypothetical protein CEUSTIGMA_g6667.t1 [Chlamydomonas eustigma]|eukprot:GAX79227.1 hypothetical protein CEUSTIGMA_g6667.t1 [Chlamydomonas eustigma]